MTTIVLQPEGVRVPGDLTNLERFRKWTHSPAFPESGRIDWVNGEVEIDMSPEDLNSHGTPRMALAGDLRQLVEPSDLDVVLIDSFRWSSPRANLSAEPDVLVVLFSTLESCAARLVERKRRKGRFIEAEGAVDIVVECVSDSSIEKDLERFPRLYYKAGAREYWVADARSGKVEFTIHARGPRGFRAVQPDRRGYLPSNVLGTSVRLVALPPRSSIVRYVLETRSGVANPHVR